MRRRLAKKSLGPQKMQAPRQNLALLEHGQKHLHQLGWKRGCCHELFLQKRFHRRC